MHGKFNFPVTLNYCVCYFLNTLRKLFLNYDAENQMQLAMDEQKNNKTNFPK